MNLCFCEIWKPFTLEALRIDENSYQTLHRTLVYILDSSYNCVQHNAEMIQVTECISIFTIKTNQLIELLAYFRCPIKEDEGFQLVFWGNTI